MTPSFRMHAGALFVYEGFTVSRSLFQKLKICEKIEKEMENMKIKCKFALQLKHFVKQVL